MTDDTIVVQAKKPPASPPAARSASVLRRLLLTPGAAWLTGLLLLGIVAVGLHMRAAPKMSPLDEMVHTDYAVQASHFHLIRYGQPVGEVAMHEEACRGIDLPLVTPPCRSGLRPEDFGVQLNGLNTAASHPPAYYFITGMTARALQGILGLNSFVTGARIAGALWLAAGLVLLWLLFAELGIGYLARVVSSSLMIVAPVTLNSTAHVNNDASAFVCGAGLLLAVLRWERRQWPAWVALLFAALAALTKITNLVVVGVAVVYLGMRALRRTTEAAEEDVEEEARRPRDLVGLAGGIVGVAFVLSVVWLRVWQSISIISPNYDPFKPLFYVDHLAPSQVIDALALGMTPARDPTTLAPFFGYDGVLLVGTVTNWLLLLGCLGAVAFRPTFSRLGSLGAATLVIALIFGPAFVLLNYVVLHEYTPPPPRYVLALFPAFVVLFGAALERPLARVGAAVFSAGAVVFTFGLMVQG